VADELDAAVFAAGARVYAELRVVDDLALRPILAERQRVTARLAQTRDVEAWQCTMERLDAEKHRPDRRPTCPTGRRSWSGCATCRCSGSARPMKSAKTRRAS
jgi:hypothetical protein